ncbi:MAG TPA: lysylphosphatidylglycerol synthase transmembrane domain-containing protein [Chitinophagales bacterium]|nr:lysylphosphatidylglycerol synthase transmembrane domain-containing protein [Chitinophagales bacterium]
MKIKIGNVIQLVLSVGLGAGLVYWFINQMTSEQIDATIESFKRANYWWLLLALSFGFLSNFARAQRWRLMLKPVGYYPGFWNTFFSINVMFFANLFIPRLGEVSRCGILAKYEGVPVEKSIGTMVVERILDLICIFILLGILLLAEYDKVSGMLFDTFSKKDSAVVAEPSHWLIKYGIPLVLIVAVGLFSAIIIRKHGLTHLIKNFKIRFKGLMEGVISIRYMKDFGQFIFLTVVLWSCYLLMTYISFYALTETSQLGILPAMGCLIFGGFAMVATPGGIGAYPLAVRAILLLYGINEVIGGAIGTMIWGTQTSGVFIMGLLSLVLLALINPSKK